MQHPYQQIFRDLAACFTHQSEVGDVLTQEINPAGKLSSTEALNVYRRAVVARLTEALGEKYKRVWRFCGDDEFFEYSYNYIMQNPSQAYDLGAYGETFPEFLKSQVPKEEAFLPELARLEQSYLKVFHMPSPHYNSAALIQKYASNLIEIRIDVSASSELISSDFAIHDLWFALKEERWDESFRNKNPQSVLLYKNENQIYMKKVSAEFVCVYHSLKESKNIESAMKILEANHPELKATDVQDSLQQLASTNQLYLS